MTLKHMLGRVCLHASYPFSSRYGGLRNRKLVNVAKNINWYYPAILEIIVRAIISFDSTRLKYGGNTSNFFFDHFVFCSLFIDLRSERDWDMKTAREL